MRMKMDRLLVVVTIVALVLGVSGIVVGDEDEQQLCIPLGSITLEAPEGVEAKRSPVEFPHATHFTYSCNVCHHKWTGTDQFLDCTTSGCHDLTRSPKKAGSSEGDAAHRYYKNAYHKSCIQCHQSIKKKNQKLAASGSILRDKLPPTGPTGCKECHPREE